MLELKSWIRGSETVQAIDGRELHKVLGIGRDLSTFVVSRIDSYGYVEGEDFAVCIVPRGSGNPAKEYLLSLPMAAELCLLDRSDIGREIRRWILEQQPVHKCSCTSEKVGLCTDHKPEWPGESQTLKACLKCLTPFQGAGELCQGCNHFDAVRAQKAALVIERNTHKAPANEWIRCLIERDGDTTMTVPGSYGTIVTFRKNQFGHAVARIENPIHRTNILKSIFYKSYDQEAA